MIGNRLGSYEITAKLGEGGMGEVYRATDTKLRRDVAIKVLPAAFTEDKERLARFEREAQLLAQLHHPNIASIFGLEESGGVRALVMELVEGETLAERMEGGRLAPAEALAIARQIAEALEAAHEKGIVHRDLKPQNIKLTEDGRVKVLDFGLAKAVEASGGISTPTQLAHSPTLTLGATIEGVILGTAAYMAPEQARGKPVDKRADIWAFGVVLYEMLSGERLFEAESVPEILSAVLTRELDWSRLAPGTPPAVRRLLRRCLARDPKDRLHDIADARIVLAELERGESDVAARDNLPAAAAARPRRWLGAALALAGLLAGLGVTQLWLRPAASEPSFHLLTRQEGFVHSARFAPDGTTIVYGESRKGLPVALQTTRSDSSASRALDLPSADVVGISPKGEMALILGRHHVGSWLQSGTLAQANLAGGSPRRLLDDVYDADIADDGSTFAVVRRVGAQQQLEYPVGKVLFRTTGWISSPRISSDGKSVVFAEHPIPEDDQGFVAVADAGGAVRRISDGLNFVHGVAWSPDGGSVYASYGAADQGAFIDVFRAGGSRRRLFSSVALLRLQDVAPSGQLLLTSDILPVGLEGRLAGQEHATFGGSTGDTVDGISADGTLFAVTDGSFLSGGEYQFFYGRSDGSPPVALGTGTAIGVTPDGRWVFAKTESRDRTKLRAVPTGAGEARTFDLGTIETRCSGTEHVTATADGRRIAFLGAVADGLPSGWVYDLAGSQPPRAVTPEGVAHVVISSDGRALAAEDPAGRIGIYDTASGARHELPGARDGETTVAWSGDGTALYVWNRTFPVRVERVEIASGRRELALEWQPTDPSGLLYGFLTVTTDARFFMARYRRGLSALVVVNGVR
jgi:Tol biopolymer transport system component/predicted Ser/Thr protein kinase